MSAIAALRGRSFVHPLFDYGVIGGGISLLFVAGLLARPEWTESIDPLLLWTLLLASNMAHFASSTVRLYTKPGAYETWPFLTLAFPLLTLALLTLCLSFPVSLGTQLQKLFLTWSPFHYAAQAYGLALMYSFRSGCALEGGDKRLLRWISLLPFLWVFLTSPGIGIHWLLPRVWLDAIPAAAIDALSLGLTVLAFATPALFFAKIWRDKRSPMPLIAPLVLLSNGIWWFVLPPMQAFLWATVFHGLQYLGIVIIFHVKDQLAQPGNTRGWLHHTLRFYAISLALGYALFRLLPQGFVMVGFGLVESLLLVIAAINVHHFIVDAFIWRLGRSADNRRIVAGEGAAA